MHDHVPQVVCMINGLREAGLTCFHVVESRVVGDADVEVSDRVDFAVGAGIIYR